MFTQLPPIRVGYLFPFTVVKTLPDKDSFLVNISNTELFGMLPRDFTNRVYRVGETGWASIAEIRGAQILLSQKNIQYIRKILDYVLNDALVENNLKIKKIALSYPYVKIVIDKFLESENDFEIPKPDKLHDIFKPYLNDDIMTEYLPNYKLNFVRFSLDINECIKRLLIYEDFINKVVVLEELEEAMVFVTNGYAGQIIGPKGKNIVTTKKLIHSFFGDIKGTLEIKVKPIDMD